MSNDPIYSVNHLVALRTQSYPNLPILGVPDKNFKYAKYTFRELDAAATLLAHHFIEFGAVAPRGKGDLSTKLCVGLFAHSGYDYVICEWALSRLGYSILLISPNNSTAAVAHLLKATASTHVFVHQMFDNTMHEVTKQLALENIFVKTVPLPDPKVYSGVAQTSALPQRLLWEPILDYRDEQDLTAFIVHSSGSTGFPKPIYISHRHSVANFSIHFNMSGFTTLPLYHNHGHSCFYRGIHSAKPFYLFPAAVLPLTSRNILTLLTSPECGAEALFGVPFALKLLAESEDGVKVLRNMKLVMYGGSPCPDELGDRLVEAGVKLVGHYGLTETGQLMTSFRDFSLDKLWNWLRPPSSGKGFLRLEDNGEGKYEVVVLKGYKALAMSNQPDGSYSTKDLFLKHPTIDDLYKFCGRLDDTLVMVSGEKTNPVPIELTLRGESPHISEAIVFGAGRSQIGALIILTESCDPAKKARMELLSLIEPALRLANLAAPSHSRLAHETIVFLSFGHPIPRADKGSFLRPKVYAAFKDVIDNIYKHLEGEDGGEGTTKKRLWNIKESQQLVLSVIKEVIGEKAGALALDSDLFERGLDSLQSTRIRNALQREIDLAGKRLSLNFVFDFPSINKITNQLLAISQGNVTVPAELTQIEQMLQLVERYSHFAIPQITDRPAAGSLTRRKVVALTGTTGSPGAAILDQLLSDPDIVTVFCLNRARNDEDAAQRTVDSMKTRKLTAIGNFKGISDPRVRCYASELGEDQLGLDPEVYNEIASTVTLIIHNAWAVNFNLSIGSFEPHIRGASNLIQLGLDSPYPESTAFFFSSSVSAVSGWQGPGPVPEEVTDNPLYAQNMGYARSKWVTEKICELAARTTPLNIGVLRIGQMVGDSRTGIWNETEAISLIFKSAETLGVLPELNESSSWLPIDYSARTIVELTDSRPETAHACPCWHVVQPRLVPWADILNSFRAAGVKFETVHRREWLARLRQSNSDPTQNPTIKLLSFFEGKYDQDDNIPARFLLSTEKTCNKSANLRIAPVPDDVLVRKFVEAWQTTKFLSSCIYIP